MANQVKQWQTGAVSGLPRTGCERGQGVGKTPGHKPNANGSARLDPAERRVAEVRVEEAR